MKISKAVRAAWSSWRSLLRKTKPAESSEPSVGESHLDLARESLRELLDDGRVPASVREALADDYRAVEAMLAKLEHGHVHIAAFGRVSVGKSSLLNALLGEARFTTSPLHGETRRPEMANWSSYDSGGVYLVDTPGINEVAGEDREKLAHEVASRVDLVLFVVDGDITDTELQALRTLAGHNRPIILVLNKADRYTERDRSLLLESLRKHTAGLVQARNIVTAAAQPAPQTVIKVSATGEEVETERIAPAAVADLQQRLWEILEAEGKTLAALNASLFAGTLTDQVTQRIMAARKSLAEKLVRTYCIAKGVAVAFNPVPVADLFAAAIMDVTMVLHLSRVYGFPITRKEAGSVVQAIVTQMLALMGMVWAINVVSAALKVGTGGLSVVVTASAQGAVAYYATYVVGQVAERYLAQGKSWGDGGPKQVVAEILDSLDRDSVLAEARKDILSRIRQ